MHKIKTGFLLAAPASGSGKTTITLALLRIFSRQGQRVQPFKCGPDYLDTRLHSLAASTGGQVRTGINLDMVMSSSGHVRNLFSRHSAEADVLVVEGVMGLYDGSVKAEGSSAAIARLLGLPVVLVVNAGKMAYSAAPLLHGFKHFDPELNLVGVLFNRVNSASHYRYLQEAAHDVGIESLGYVPHNETIVVEERYLGLNTSVDYDRDGIINAMADHLMPTVDVERLKKLATISVVEPEAVSGQRHCAGERVIAVARDEAFNFLYAENLSVLAEHGRLEFFSPLTDQRLPKADMLYLAGGYPELYARTLEKNKAMRRQIFDYAQQGGVVYAECGGMMYLSRHLHLQDGTSCAMSGVLDLEASMQQSRLHLGYRSFRLPECYSGELRGHEFHYSTVIGAAPFLDALVSDARGKILDTRVFRFKNVFATYIHAYWGETRDFPASLLALNAKQDCS